MSTMIRTVWLRPVLLLLVLCNVHGRDDATSSSIKVIGAGFGRTGTLSLSKGLEILGYRPCHYVDFAHASQWAAHATGDQEVSTDEIIDLLVASGYNATVENPTADIYADILERFPSAKVVLTVRDDAEKFEKSWKQLFDTMEVTERPFSLTFPSFFQWIPLFRHLKALRCRMGMHLGLEPCALTSGWRSKPNGWLAEQYEAHNAQVIQTVPSDQLLVFNVKEGWGPLCDFLGFPEPDVPFPNMSKGVNDAAAMKRLRIIFLVVIYGWIPLLLLVMLCMKWVVARCCVRRPKKDKQR